VDVGRHDLAQPLNVIEVGAKVAVVLNGDRVQLELAVLLRVAVVVNHDVVNDVLGRRRDGFPVILVEIQMVLVLVHQQHLRLLVQQTPF